MTANKRPKMIYLMVPCETKAQKERFRRAAAKADVSMAKLVRTLLESHCAAEGVR